MAGLIPQSFIDDLLERVDIVEVIDRRVALKKAGHNFKACCPFHDEKTPSFNVNPDKQYYHCFGCGAGGNAVGFIMDYENIDFPAAIEALAAVAGVEVPREDTGNSNNRRNQQRINTLYDTLEFATRFFQMQLRQHANKSQAINYLKQRGLSGEIARDFAIGYAPAGWDNLIQAVSASHSSSSDQQTQLQQLEAVGLVVKKENGGYYDRFRERVIFPIRDNRGRIIAFGGRVLNDEKPKYLNSPESDVFHKQRELYGLFEARKKNRQLDYLLMVEGYMDVVSLFQYGITHAVATLGTASSHFHLEKIFRHTSKLVVCFDGDEAGKKAADRVLETALPAMQDGREICFLFLPAGDDPDTFVREHGKQAFLDLADSAMPLEDLLLATASRDVQANSKAGKARICQNALPLIAQLPSGIFKHSMLSQLAEYADTTAEVLQQQLASLPSRQKTVRAQNAAAKPSNNSEATISGSASALRQSSAPISESNSQPNQATSPLSSNAEPESFNAALLLGISTLLHYPELAIELAIPSAVQASQTAEPQVFIKLVEHIQHQLKALGQPPSMAMLLGHWHGEPEAQTLIYSLNMDVEPENQHVAEQQLSEALAKIEAESRSKDLDVLIGSLSHRTPSQLSESEKKALKAIGKGKISHNKP